MWQLQTLALSQSSVIPSFGSDDALQTFSCCQSCCGNIYPAVKRDFNLLVPLRTFLKKPSCANKRKYSHWHRRRMCTFKQTMKSFIAFFFIWKSN